MSRMEDSITDGPQPDDEQIIPEPEFERDTSLVDVLKDIATGLGEDFMKKEQAE